MKKTLYIFLVCFNFFSLCSLRASEYSPSNDVNAIMVSTNMAMAVQAQQEAAQMRWERDWMLNFIYRLDPGAGNFAQSRLQTQVINDDSACCCYASAAAASCISGIGCCFGYCKETTIPVLGRYGFSDQYWCPLAICAFLAAGAYLRKACISNQQANSQAAVQLQQLQQQEDSFIEDFRKRTIEKTQTIVRRRLGLRAKKSQAMDDF